MHPKVTFQELGCIDYKTAWEYQSALQQRVIATKLHNRDLAPADSSFIPQTHYLLFCDHPHVYTLGRSGKSAHLLLSEAEMEARGIQYFPINRGGDITYHGPGQIIGYPIFDMECFFTDVHRYVRCLEEAVIQTLTEYGIKSDRMKGYTGVWLPATVTQPHRKICAIGVHLSRWVTLHGFAFNVCPDLQYFNYIVPCGIAETDKSVTSLEKELGQTIDMAEVKGILLKKLQEIFDCTILSDEGIEIL
jgi:lipoyl(octanoyl) transferase